MHEPKDISMNNASSAQRDHYHTAVLKAEVINGLNIVPEGIYVDCTFGGGGHSRAILELLNEKGRLFVFDQDADAKANVPSDSRVQFVQQNFRYMQRFLRVHKIKEVDGILADLGVSSFQFDEAERGFSTRFDAPLDMRMNQAAAITAADILEKYSEFQLHKLFEKYGEVTNAKTLAKTISEQRMLSPIKTISRLKQATGQIVKGNPNKYYAQVFQALRIEVNDELGALKELLEQSSEVLKTGGRIAVISFHSLEDRLVKNFFKQGAAEQVQSDDLFGVKPENPFTVLTKKPIVAGHEELKANPRSRSAKLRIAEKR